MSSRCCVTPRVSRFSVLRWPVLVLQGDDSLFKSKFCVAYQAMSTIGYQFPADYAAVASTFVLS